MNEPKIISQETVFKASLFEVKKVELVFPTGGKRIHYIAERVPIVSVFPITDSYEIYLISQYRYLLEKVSLEAVAGHVEKEETSLQAAKRELEEEAGIIGEHWEEIARVGIAGSVFKSTSHLFLVKNFRLTDPKPEEGENISLIKMSLDKAVEKVLNGEITHSVSMTGILMLDKLKQQKKL